MNKLLIVLLIVVAACNPKPTPASKLTALKPATALDEWKVDGKTAIGMINSVKGKACNAFTITNQNAAMQAVIDSLYPLDKFTYSQINARYLSNADEAKYRRLRGLPPGSAKGDIRGLCTTLFVVRSISAKEAAGLEEYFDIYTICPPPPDCDRDSN